MSFTLLWFFSEYIHVDCVDILFHRFIERLILVYFIKHLLHTSIIPVVLDFYVDYITISVVLFADHYCLYLSCFS